MAAMISAPPLVQRLYEGSLRLGARDICKVGHAAKPGPWAHRSKLSNPHTLPFEDLDLVTFV